jgi:UDP-N-acetylmuramoyl-L-alanyl-D-glutamate--2,6-diaminopimelate ligase
MDELKQSSIARFFYNIPGVASTYHFFWAWVGASVHRKPSKKLFVIGVTGTKGKTTTLELLNAILETAGKRTALLSSLRIKIADESRKNETGNSMPGHGYVQKLLRDATHAGCNYALVEVTSQAVVQHRHRFISWNMGVMTNLAPEHIEAHGSFEKYREAKLDFLRYVIKKGGKVFLNRDDKNFGFFSSALAEGRPLAYSKDDESLRNYFSKMEPEQTAREQTPPKFLLSNFNAENVAVAVAIAKELGIPNQFVEEALVNFAGVPGRMEFIKEGTYTAIVDYAHTPDSLEAAYRAVKPAPNATYRDPKLICVLGAAGGGRDTWKRPAMGTIASDYCDEIILTNEDPYDEDPQKIIKEVRSGILGGEPNLANVYEIPDRAEAIKKAISLMHDGDVVIGTGKGSEDWIHIARGRKIRWSERDAFEDALRARTKILP